MLLFLLLSPLLIGNYYRHTYKCCIHLGKCMCVYALCKSDSGIVMGMGCMRICVMYSVITSENVTTLRKVVSAVTGPQTVVGTTRQINKLE